MKNDLNLSAGEWVMPSISLYLYLRGGGKGSVVKKRPFDDDDDDVFRERVVCDLMVGAKIPCFNFCKLLSANIYIQRDP